MGIDERAPRLPAQRDIGQRRHTYRRWIIQGLNQGILLPVVVVPVWPTRCELVRVNGTEMTFNFSREEQEKEARRQGKADALVVRLMRPPRSPARDS